MEMASYLVAAVVVEGLSVRKVAKEHGVSKTWLYELVARYEADGEAGLVPRSKRLHRSPTKVADRFENEIVRLRKELTEEGFDAGAETIRMHLRQANRRAKVPSVSTIWRVLKARGFVVPEPHKRPRSSYARFEADLPNECWQMDVTHVLLANGREVEILNVIDDHSRLCVSSVALFVFKAIDVVHTFYKAAGTWGLPAAVLSDIQADCALGSTVRPAGGGKLQGDRCPLGIAAHRSERLTTPCPLGVSRAGATPGKERPVKELGDRLRRIPVGECPARPSPMTPIVGPDENKEEVCSSCD
jgi:transposase